MQKVSGIGGVFFRARDPEGLAGWYTTNLGIDIADSVWQQRAGPTVFSPFRNDTEYFGRPEQQWMINFRVADLDAMVAQLRAGPERGLQLAGQLFGANENQGSGQAPRARLDHMEPTSDDPED